MPSGSGWGRCSRSRRGGRAASSGSRPRSSTGWCVGEGHQVGVTLVKAFVAEWKRQRQEVFVPLVYRPGDLGEVDFFEVLVDVGGKRRKAWMFVMRLMHSGRDFAWLYERQDQVSFLDGHVRASEHFGAVPLRLLYDNLRPAVAKVLVGLGAEADGADGGTGGALPLRAVLRPAEDRPRQGRRGGPGQGHPLGAPRAHPLRGEPGAGESAARGAARPTSGRAS